jgi:PAS domain S-box-containing protein
MMTVTIPTNVILESISDGVFTVDCDWKVTSFNRAAEEITGVSREEAIGRLCSEVFRASLCEQGCPLRRARESGRPVINESAFIVDAEGQRIPISIGAAALRDAEGRVIGGAETFRDLSLVEALRAELQGRVELGDLVSRSRAMRRVFDLVEAISQSDATALIQGETGTGKELIARALHNLGPRRGGPFVAVNCGAFPDTLLEAELFGHTAGAFTGATKRRDGRFAAAAGGTLLLDEIGETSPAMQVKLLRVLQERTYEPLGSSRALRTDVRVVAATNRDLAAEVARGAFREDLYYRVRVVEVRLPPLRDRREDVPLLVERFVARFNRLQGRSVPGVAPTVLSLLAVHDWPGNVRELENVIERAFILCGEGPIEDRHLPPELTGQRAAAPVTLEEAVREAERRQILAAIQRNGNSRLAAARELGIHKSTLFRKVAELGLRLPDPDGRNRSDP